MSLFRYCVYAIRSHPRTRNKFVETVPVTECYLITKIVKSKESKKQPFQICRRVKSADGRISMKKGKNYPCLIYGIFNLGKMAGNLFHECKLNINL